MSKKQAIALTLSFFFLINIGIISASVNNPQNPNDDGQGQVEPKDPTGNTVVPSCEEEGQTLNCEFKDDGISFDIDGDYTVVYIKEITYDKDFSNVLAKDLPGLLNIHLYNNADKQLVAYEGEGKLISYSKSEFEFVIDMPNGDQEALHFTVLSEKLDDNSVVLVETLQKQSVKTSRVFVLSLVNTIVLLVVLKMVADFMPEDRNL